MDLPNISNFLFEKPAWAYLNYKGEFSKYFNKLVWADSNITRDLFECKEIVGKSLFTDFITEFSKFNIRKTLGENFYDFKVDDKRLVNVKFTIKTKRNDSDCKDALNLENKVFDHMNSVKTLKCCFSTIILQEQDDQFRCVILMKAYLARIRENFDDLVMMNLK